MRSILMLVLLFFGFQCLGLPWSALFKPSRLKVKNPKVINRTKPKVNLEKELVIEPDSKPKVKKEFEEESNPKLETVKKIIKEPITQLPESIIDTTADTLDEDSKKDKM